MTSSPLAPSLAPSALVTSPNDLTVAQQQTDYLLLDGSGSMTGENWFRSCASIDSYVSGLRAEHLESHLILNTFDSTDMELIQRDTPISSWVPLHDSPIGAHWGGTPLYDAINLAARRLRSIDPQRAALTVLTDGEENASQHTSLEQCRAIIRWMQAKGWQVVFIGCEFANHRLAERLGLLASQAIGVQRALLSSATSELAKKRATYGRTGAPMHWTESEQQQFGGYLAAPRTN